MNLRKNTDEKDPMKKASNEKHNLREIEDEIRRINASITTLQSDVVTAQEAADAAQVDIDALIATGISYSVGTWTPGIAFGGAAVGVTYSVQVGNYMKIGQWVFAGFQITLTSNGTSVGAATITGLPFTITATGSTLFPATPFLRYVTFANQFQMVGINATTTIGLYEITEAGVQTTLAETDVPDNSIIRGSIFYRTA